MSSRLPVTARPAREGKKSSQRHQQAHREEVQKLTEDEVDELHELDVQDRILLVQGLENPSFAYRCQTTHASDPVKKNSTYAFEKDVFTFIHTDGKNHEKIERAVSAAALSVIPPRLIRLYCMTCVMSVGSEEASRQDVSCWAGLVATFVANGMRNLR